jgi:hypothetical protein
MFTGLIHDAMPEQVTEWGIKLADQEAARLASHPALPMALERRARRDAERYGAQELGLPQPVRFLTVYDFFDDYLAPAFEIQDRNQDKHWCPRWWDHQSVLFRITAMWRKYELMRLESPAGVDEEFIRFVIDHHMPILLGPTSPMKNCTETTHQPSRRLKSTTREVNNNE